MERTRDNGSDGSTDDSILNTTNAVLSRQVDARRNSTPLGSSRAPAGNADRSQRGLTTSSRRAPGWNRTALAKASFEAKAVLRMFRPALICRSISQSHISQTNTLPTLSRRRAPHTGQVLLVHAGLTLITGTPARAALYSIWRCNSRRGHDERRRFIRRERPPAPRNVSSSSTKPDIVDLATWTSPLLTTWRRWLSLFRSLLPSRCKSLLRTRRSWVFFLAKSRRRRKCVACTTRTSGNGTVTRVCSPAWTATPSRESSFVSSAIAPSGWYGSGAALLTAKTIRSEVTVSEPSPQEGSAKIE